MKRLIAVLMALLVLSGCATEVSYYKRGVNHERKGEYRKAADLYKKSLVKNPGYALSYYGLGSVYSKSKLYDESLANLLKAGELGIDDQDIHMLMGAVYEALGKSDLAADEYGKAIQARPDDVLSHLKLGATLEKARDYDGALAEYRSASMVALDFPEAYYHSARMLFQLKRYREAEDIFLHALHLRKKYPEAQDGLTMLYLADNRFQAARESAEKTMAMDEGYTPGLVSMGRICELQGNDRLAKKLYRRAIKQKREDDSAHFRLALLLKRENDISGAEREFQTVVMFNPDHSSAYNELGMITLARGEYPWALDFFRSAIRADSTSAAPYYNTAGILVNTGDYTGATAVLRQYLSHATDAKDSLDIEARIRFFLSAEEKK